MTAGTGEGLEVKVNNDSDEDVGRLRRGQGGDVSGEERGGQRKLRDQRSQIEKHPHTRREKGGVKQREEKRTGQSH